MGPLESHGSHTAPTTRCLLPQGAAKGSILGGSQHLGGLLLNGDMTLKTHNAVKKVVFKSLSNDDIKSLSGPRLSKLKA